jgi:uncharacterized protein (TIGR03083 family)
MGGHDEPILGLLAAEWAAIAELGATLTDDDWERPTDLPGWTAKDCLSHMVGSELALLGEPAPDVAVDHLPHVASPFAAMIEVWVEARRATPGSEVLDEFTAATTRRLDVLGAMGDDEWSRPGWSPVGEVPYRTFMEVRVFDCWMHEQDIRRAVGRPGGLDTDPAELSLGRIGDGLGFVVGKRAGAPEGTTVVVEVTGPRARTWALGVTDRARTLDVVPADPTVRLRTDLETLCALGGGRWDRRRAAGNVEVAGDPDLAARILDGMAITP